MNELTNQNGEEEEEEYDVDVDDDDNYDDEQQQQQQQFLIDDFPSSDELCLDASNINSSPLLEREFNIFISSPFLDMNEERDLLVKRLFLKIRKFCDERDVIFSYTDLRWGITDSEIDNGNMLLHCLDK